MSTEGITAALHWTALPSPLLCIRGGLSISLTAHTANFSCQVQLPECTREIGCLYSVFLSLLSSLPVSLLLVPSHIPSVPDSLTCFISLLVGTQTPLFLSPHPLLWLGFTNSLGRPQSCVSKTYGSKHVRIYKIKVHPFRKTGVVST